MRLLTGPPGSGKTHHVLEILREAVRQGRTDTVLLTPTATMADSDEVRVGDWCFAIGNPFLLATDFKPTVSYGIVSGVRRRPR